MNPLALLPDRYSAENARRVLRNPRLLRRELFTVALTVNSRTRDVLNALEGTDDGIDVIAADWDNLLILDACRYDLFAARSTLEGDLREVRSKGSDSGEFVQRNFAGRTLHDTVYVTANPHVHHLEDGVFHAVVDLLDDRWDEEAETVRPEAVVEEAIAAHERFPEKRLIVHFMQPHFPFLGPTGRTFAHQGLDADLENRDAGEANPWFRLIYDDDVDVATVCRAYRENLDLVLPHVEDLLEALSGKSVVTADHGNLIGERGFPIPVPMYGHPRGLHREDLLAVPWLEVASTDRRRILPEPPVDGRGDPDEDVLERRLTALGYA